MTAIGGVRQRSGSISGLAGGAGRLLRAFGVLVGAVLVLALAGAAGLAWRLSQGPLDVGWLARRVERAANGPDSPTRLHIEQAMIRWAGFNEGAGRGLELELRGLRVVNRSGAPGAELAEADASLSLGRLLTLHAVPRSVLLTGLRLGAVREEDGTVTLDLGSMAGAGQGDPADGPAPSLAETLSGLGRPPETDRSASPAGTGARSLGWLAQLRHVRLRDAVVEVADRQLAATLQLSVATLDLERQQGGGVRGTAEGQVGLGGAVASLHLAAELAPDGGTQLRATLAPVASAALARSNPALAGLAVLDAAVQATATLELSPAMRPRAAELHVSAGAGRLRLRKVDLPFQSLALDGQAGWPDGELKPDRVSLRRVQAVLASPGGAWSTTLGGSGEAKRANGRIDGQLDLTLDHVAFADLPALWPEGLGGNVRPWLTQNLTAGTARDGHVSLTLTGSDNLDGLKVTQASGALLGDDVTIHWLRPVPPIEHAQAVLTVKNPDVIDIAVPSGREGGMTLRDGTIHITGLSVKDQVLALAADVAGPVPDVVALLRHPRLKLLDRHPIPMRNPAGTLNGRLTVDLPLEHNLEMEQVKIHGTGRLTALRLGGLVAGRDLDQGDIQIDVTSDALKASGRAAIATMPSELSVEMDFRPGPGTQVVQRATARTRANGRQLAAAGLGPGGLMPAGTGAFEAEYTARRDGRAEVRATADLREAGLSLAGWQKAPGQPASAAVHLLLQQDKLAGIDELRAQGPGLQLTGRAEMVGDRPAALHLDRIVLGPTQASGEIRFPAGEGEPLRARLSGTVLDLSAELSRKPAHPASSGGGGKGGGTPWVADIRFDRVLLAQGRSVGGVSAHAESDGRHLRLLRADSTGPERLQAAIAPEGNGRHVSLRAADGGALLRALDVIDTVQGGRLALEGHYDDSQAEPPLAGTAELTGFTLRDAPAVGKLLQAMTVYGVVEALSGPGLAFSQLTLPFRYDGNALDVGEARAFSASLGITAQGRVDLARKSVDLRGTIVPAYVINSALGRIPLIGRLFSPERGGGLLSVNYTVRGALADPAVTVNPLSALTPGFLRGLFKIFN